MGQLHSKTKTTSAADSLLVAAMGCQEGAIDNVKANFPGEQV